jgi:hypothetical protein
MQQQQNLKGMPARGGESGAAAAAAVMQWQPHCVPMTPMCFGMEGWGGREWAGGMEDEARGSQVQNRFVDD